jgi:hypothetical protein
MATQPEHKPNGHPPVADDQASAGRIEIISAQHRGHIGNGFGNKTWRHCRDGVKRDVMTWMHNQS